MCHTYIQETVSPGPPPPPPTHGGGEGIVYIALYEAGACPQPRGGLYHLFLQTGSRIIRPEVVFFTPFPADFRNFFFHRQGGAGEKLLLAEFRSAPMIAKGCFGWLKLLFCDFCYFY